MIPHNKPTVDEKEIRAMANVLKSGWLAQGIQVQNFENEFCKYLESQPGHAVAVSSGSAALYVVLISLGIGEGDEVIIPTFVCSALLNSIYLIHAKPVLADIDPNDFNISYDETSKRITSRTKAIIVPHIFGMPAQIEKLIKLGIPVIEDCAQSIGAKASGKYVGNFGYASVFSFYASKMMTTGYGGMVFSKNKEFINKVRDYREFDCRKNYKPRFNFQMADFQAAIGREQLKKLPSFLAKRKKIASKYNKIIRAPNAWPPQGDEDRQSNFYRFLIRTGQPKDLKEFMEKKGIATIVPIETYELLHRYLGLDPRDFPVSEAVSKSTLSLPIYPSLTDIESDKIILALKSFLS